MKLTKENLSTEQKDAYDKIMNFVKKSSDRQFMFSGYSGSGKSTLLKFIVSEFDMRGIKYVCTAPTNEAVRVLSKIINRDFHDTIYSLLGLVLIQDDDREPVLKAIGSPKLNDFEIVIIDEASMIHEELFNMIQEQMEINSWIKVIFVGDKAQLPPVKDPNKESRCFSITPSCQMTQVQRAAKGNPITDIATIIRTDLTVKEDVFSRESKINEELKSGVEFITDVNDFMKKMFIDFISPEAKKDSNYVRAIAYTNKSVDYLNKKIRSHIYINKEVIDEYELDESLIVTEPVVERKGKILDIVYPVGERLRILEVKKGVDLITKINYWNLLVHNAEEPEYRRVKKWLRVIPESEIVIYKKTLTKYADEAKRKQFLQDDHGNRQYNNREAWAEYFEFKGKFSWVKYSYATTTHRSQGSTFTRVYVVERDLNKLTWDDVERNKLKYVAFTRASHLLRILH